MRKNLFVGIGLMFITTLAQGAVSCSISSEELTFGVINPLSPGDITSIAAVNLDCSGGPVSYTIKLSQGTGTLVQRVMKSGFNVLKYNIYTSNSYSRVLGDGTMGSVAITGSSATDSTEVTHYVYGKISNIGLSNTAAGIYADTISMVIHY
ncbi:MAG: spore coat protein U-like protein [Paraglaciecola sp.]|jgi:spore coat protein U-like protein